MKDPARQSIDDALKILCEHFESVQILASYEEGGQTRCCSNGSGNWYARQGMAHEFINQDIAQENAHQIAEKMNPPDQD